ncbi:MAG: hypothetical protein GVY19_06610 [Bacteroidetes bacterium]|jgi:hypothetical protein|nr:hypothetical protein [Bacteroidota bacterium]
MGDQKEIFFHVGLGKTASTYLQYSFFPKLTNIRYFQRSKYKRFHSIIERTNYTRYFFSREFDRQFEREVRKIANYYPQAGIIVILRRHDSWMASQYRRYVKNGGAKSFEDFFRLEDDNGLWQTRDVYFYPRLQLLQELFSKKPLVLFHDDLKKDAYNFFDRITHYLGAEYDKQKVSLDPVHKSYNTKQLLVIRKISKYLFSDKKKKSNSSSPFVNYVRFRSKWLLCHLILYVSLLLPKRWTPQEDLVSAESLARVREFFEDDWQQCVDFEKSFSA